VCEGGAIAKVTKMGPAITEGTSYRKNEWHAGTYEREKAERTLMGAFARDVTVRTIKARPCQTKKTAFAKRGRKFGNKNKKFARSKKKVFAFKQKGHQKKEGHRRIEKNRALDKKERTARKEWEKTNKRKKPTSWG